MKTYDLYGIATRSLDSAKRLVELILGVELKEHDSAYRGLYFRLGPPATEHFVLQRNGDSRRPGEWMEPKHKDWPYLLYVNETNRSDDLQAILTQSESVALIRHEVF